jgi:hypothetical protein
MGNFNTLNSMKQILLMSIILLVSLSSFAQGGGQRMTVEDRAKRTTDWMKTELKLTEQQIVPVDSINLLYAKTQQLLFQAAEGDRDKVRESMTGLEKEKENALSKVLTSSQLETYKAKTKEMMENFRNRGGGSR